MNKLRVEKLNNDPQSVPKGTFGYYATGNRTAATWLGSSTSLTYPSTSHRLVAVAGEARTYDAMGNPLTIGTRQLRYDDRAKLDQVTLPGGEVWQYRYTGQGLRVTKRKADDSSSLRHFVYDESAQLIGEYDHAGAPLREVIWLVNLPIGVIDGTSATPVLHYIESDHLGTDSPQHFPSASLGLSLGVAHSPRKPRCPRSSARIAARLSKSTRQVTPTSSVRSGTASSGRSSRRVSKPQSARSVMRLHLLKPDSTPLTKRRRAAAMPRSASFRPASKPRRPSGTCLSVRRWLRWSESVMPLRGLAGIDAFFTHKQRNVLLLMEISGFLALFGHPGARRFWRS